MDELDQYSGFTFGGSTYVVEMFPRRKQYGLYRRDGATYTTVAVFKSHDEAVAFRDWFIKFGVTGRKVSE